MRRFVLTLLFAGLLPGLLPGPTLSQSEGRRRPPERRGFDGPVVDLDDQGQALFLWAHPVEGGHDLLLARRAPDGSLGDPVRVNPRSGSVRWWPLDEARPMLCTGEGGRVAVGWFDRSGRPWVARSTDGGRSFEAADSPSTAAGHEANAFVEGSFDPRGDLHVVWLDARLAPAGEEEPAHLFYRRWHDRRWGPEIDLSPDLERGVCGCCRPAVQARGEWVEVFFRARDAQGYRDIHRARRRGDVPFEAAERMGPPTWKIEACPMAGPVGLGERVVWLDGSTGETRLVENDSPTTRPREVLSVEGFRPLSPRRVPAMGADDPLLLLPGEPFGRILQLHDGRWRVLVEQTPPWCHSAVVLDGQFLLVGDQQSRLKVDAVDLSDPAER